MRTMRPLVDRFWEKVEKAEGDGCWLWTGAMRPGGYGVIGEGARGGRTLRASRLSYELAHGPFDEKLFVCHRCDNPRCVRPDHLFLGTNADNVADARQKGRMKPPPLHSGEQCHLAKLKAIDVQEIRRLAAAGVDRREIASRFSVSHDAVKVIVARKAWRDVA